MKTDIELREDVSEELRWEPSIDETEIGVTTKNGVVTLSGTVESYAKKLAAEKAAKRVKGVKAVVEKIEVKLGTAEIRTDEDIALATVNALKWNTAVPEDKVKIKVENGWVYLEGELEWQYQKEAAKNSINRLRGVRGVTNNIIIKSALVPTDVKSKIVRAFERSAEIDAQNVRVETDDHTVTIRGMVRSIAEKKEAESAAWSAPGVWNVKNELLVEEPVYV